MRRLHPEPADVTVAAAYTDPRRRACAAERGRPWVQLCMVSSLDGSIALDGRSTGLAGPTDLEVLVHLRRSADIVLVGAGTVRAERYQPRETVRVAVVSGSLDLDWSWPLWRHPNTLVVTHEAAGAVPDGVAVLRCGAERVDLPAVLDALGRRGIGVVQCEGGPRFNATMLAAAMVDEICLTIGRVAVGGPGERLVVGPPLDAAFTLEQVCTADGGDLYLRYLR